MAVKKIVGLGGTFRQASSSEMLVRAVLARCEAMGAETLMFDGPSLASLPHFNPENAERTPAQSALIAAVRDADGIVIGSPGYHGGYSGLVKNAVDLLEDLRSDGRVYFDGRPVGLVVTAAGWQACGTTLSALRDVVHAMRGWPTPIGIGVNSVEQRPFGHDGNIVDVGIGRVIQAQAEQIMSFVMGNAT
nr:NADPH-dependent FMN reductase [Novosphingobium sp. P6W]